MTHLTKPTPKEKAAGGVKTTTATRSICTIDSTGSDLTLTTIKTESRVDSRLLAQHLHNKHQTLFELVKDYRADFEVLGLIRFQTGEIDGRGRPEKFVMLNEDQSFLALTYSRNTARVRALKMRLVKAFGEARRAADMRRTDYLPAYHAMHDKIKTLAADSSNKQFVHMTFNKALNTFAGVKAGQRPSATVPQQALLTVGQLVMAAAMQEAHDHHDGYQLAKQRLLVLNTLTMTGGARHE